MGYETTLIFVSIEHPKKLAGYCQVIGSVEMCKVTYGRMAELNKQAHRFTVGQEEALRKEVRKCVVAHNQIYNSEGNYNEEAKKMPEDEREVLVNKYHRASRVLENKLPYIFWEDGNIESFEDSYGDLLLVVSLEELKEAIEYDRAQDIIKNDGNEYKYYRRFDLALNMINTFLNNKDVWDHENIKVVMWGH